MIRESKIVNYYADFNYIYKDNDNDDNSNVTKITSVFFYLRSNRFDLRASEKNLKMVNLH